MGIKLNVGASTIWKKKGWYIIDHKLKENTGFLIKGDAANMNLEFGSSSLVFCCHMFEHIPHTKIQNVILEFVRV